MELTTVKASISKVWRSIPTSLAQSRLGLRVFYFSDTWE